MQATVPDVLIVGPMTDDQFFKDDGKLVLVKAEVMSGLVRCFAGQGGHGDLGEPNSRSSGNQRV